MDLASELKKFIKGEVSSDPEVLQQHSRDMSAFEMKPSVVISPQNKEDLQNLVLFVWQNKQSHPELSITARGGGTDMTGGSLTNSICVDTQHFNHIGEVIQESITVEAGTLYKDFETEIRKRNFSFPSYSLPNTSCTVGGMVANNAGGEKSFAFGKIEKYIEELDMILADGKEYTFKKLSKENMLNKLSLETFEGQIYQKTYMLLETHFDLIQSHRPKVSKNSSGYNIWNVWDRNIFDIPQLIVGSQGTLGIITKITCKLIPKKKETGMLLITMNNYAHLTDILRIAQSYHPVSIESFDDYTLQFALKYIADFAPVLHVSPFFLELEFLPEFIKKKKHTLPKLTLLIEFEEDEKFHIDKTFLELQTELAQFTSIHSKIISGKTERETQRIMSKESFIFDVIHKKISNKKPVPFIDDFCVDPKVLPELLPKIYKICNENNLIYSVTGHIGNGNLHIFPLLDMTAEAEREKIFIVGEKIYDVVLEYGGSLSGEYGDGLIRSPYLKKQFGEEIYSIFEQMKQTFDPLNIFNPGKKVGITTDMVKQFLMKTNEIKSQTLP